MQSFRPSLAISAIFHAVILLFGLISFAPKSLDAVRTETMAIDLVPISEFTLNKAGSSKALANPNKVAETKGDPKELTDLVQKVTEKQEVKAAAPPPPADEKKPEAKVEDKKPEAKPDPKPDPKEALKKAEPPKKPEPPKEEPKTAAQQMKAAPTKRDFDPNKIAALLDRREPQRPKVASEMPLASSLGINRGDADQLSMSELDAIKRKLISLWNPPVGVDNPQELIVTVRFKLKRDGTLDGSPLVMNSGQSQNFMIARDKAIRAIFMAQPFDKLPVDKYDLWHDIEVTFDPRDMSGG
jgi:outer membrane biosynthesis protein TonB